MDVPRSAAVGFSFVWNNRLWHDAALRRVPGSQFAGLDKAKAEFLDSQNNIVAAVEPMDPTFTAPGGLWLFGEQGIVLVVPNPYAPASKDRARLLFPEAEIDTDATPWMGTKFLMARRTDVR